MPFAENNDCKIHYRVEAKGNVLVLIAGLGADMNYWPPAFIRLLKKNFKLVLIDNRGAGLSGKPDEKYTVKKMAHDVLCVLDHAGINNANICGISLGGFIAQEFVINYPEKVNKCILIATHFGGPNRVKPDFNDTAKLVPDPKLSREENAKKALSVLYSVNFLNKHEKALLRFFSREKKNPMPAHAFLRQNAAGKDYISETRLQNVKCPVLILQGDEDKIIKPGNAKLMEGKLKNAKAVIFPGAGHSLPVEKPGESAKYITDFILDI